MKINQAGYGVQQARSSVAGKSSGFQEPAEMLSIGERNPDSGIISKDTLTQAIKSGGDKYMSDINEWNPEVEKRVDAFLDKVKSGEIKDPKGVFDGDGTIWSNDIGERFLEWLIENKKLKDVDYSKDIYKEYEELVKEDPTKGFEKAVTLMNGIEEKDLKKWAADFFPQHFQHNVFPKQKELLSRLQEAGVEVWIVSASNRWSVEAAAPYVGIDPSHVIAMSTEVVDGKLTDRIVQPSINAAGKVEAIKKHIGNRVDFVSGNSMSDFPMLGFSSGMSLVINPKDAGPENSNLMALSEKHDWAIQKWDRV